MNNPKVYELYKLSWIMWLLFSLFVFRVIAQIVVALVDVPFLPPFDAWYSGALVLVFQLAIIIIMFVVILKIAKNKLRPHRKLGRWLLILGSIYFFVMLIRLTVFWFSLSDLVWFNRPIPAFFHLVLALFVLSVGGYHKKHSYITGSR